MKRIDIPLVLFSVITLAALVVSAPASYNLIALYHSDGSTAGVVATWALLLILEVGAVAAKLATLWVRQGGRALHTLVVFALGVNTLSNWAHGGTIAQTQGMHWASAWIGALVYAAFLPGLIYLMLTLICGRVEHIRGDDVTIADEAATLLRPVAHAVALANATQRTLAQLQPAALALPEQATYARPAEQRSQPVLMPQEACPMCGEAASKMQLRTAAQHSGWRCKCGHKVGLVECDGL